MSWTELAHVTAHYFKRGEHAWVPGEHETDLAIGVFDTSYYDDYLWKTNGIDPIEHCIDDNHVLLNDVFRFEIMPLSTGKSNDFWPAIGLLYHESEQASFLETFGESVPDLWTLAEHIRGESTDTRVISFLTVWECEAGKSGDTPDGPGEYFSNWWLIGYVRPTKNGVEVVYLVDVQQESNEAALLTDATEGRR